MPRYRYIATDAEGRLCTGALDAGSEHAATSALGARGLRVESLHADAASAEHTPLTGRLSEHQLVEFTRHVGSLNQAGLPLPSGLRALSEELPRGAERTLLAQVADQIEAGHSLDEALEAQGDRFPKHVRGLVLAGVESGRLGEVLEQFAHYHHLGAELRRKLWLTLAYPVMLLGVLSVLIVLVAGVIVSTFARIFSDFGMQIPRLTLFVMAAARAVTDVGGGLLALIVLALSLVAVAGLIPGGAAFRQRFFRSLPLFGPLWRWTALVEFSHLLGLLLECDLPLATALQLTGGGLRNTELATACEHVKRKVETGHGLADAIEGRAPFPPGLAQLLRWAESSRSLPEALHLTGELYETRARAQASFVSILCLVIAILLVFWGIGLTVLALMLPMYNLISALSL